MGRAAWALVVALAVGVGAYALAAAFVPELRGSFVQDLFREKSLRAFGHLAFGGIAIVAGGLQFSRRLRTSKPSVHRLLGKAYVIAVLVSGISAALLAPVSDGGLTGHFGFGIMAVLWLGTTITAYLKIRAADYQAHREWMIRSYALCLAAVTLRIYLPLSLANGIPFEQAYPAIAWLCWVPNLIVAEWFVVRSGLLPVWPEHRDTETG